MNYNTMIIVVIATIVASTLSNLYMRYTDKCEMYITLESVIIKGNNCNYEFKR